MSIEQQRKIPPQFLEQIASRQEEVSLPNGQKILLSPRHAAVLRFLQTAEGPLSKGDLEPYLEVVVSGISRLNTALGGSGYKVENVALKRKGRGTKAQYVLVETKGSKEAKKVKTAFDTAKTKNNPESIELAKKELVIDAGLVILSHLSKGLMEDLTNDATRLLKGAHQNKNVTLASVTSDYPEMFLAKSLPSAFERWYSIDPKDKTLSEKEKQIVTFCNQLKENGWQIEGVIDAVLKHFDIPNPDN